jgi:hypothetical protein
MGITEEESEKSRPEERVFDHSKGPNNIDCNIHCPALNLGEKYPNYVYKGVFDEGPYCKIGPRSYETSPRMGIKRCLPTFHDLRKCVYWDKVVHGKIKPDSK